MRARALLIALVLLSAFAGTRLASGGSGLSSLMDAAVAEVEGPARVLSPVGGPMGGSALGRGAGNATAAEVGLPARVVDYPPTSSGFRSFPSIDYTDPEAGPRAGTTEWRVVGGTGNAAELWLTIAKGGWILDLGGRYVNYSDDLGKTWKSVRPSEELVNAEGSVLQAPNGDIVAVTWDPYSGDRVLTYKYTAAEGRWYYTYQPIHTPFWDRPGIDVVPGNFRDPLGAEVPYITFINGLPHDPWQYSWDGLNYPGVSSRIVDGATTAKIESWLDVKPNPMLDYMQPNVYFPFAPLGEGRAWSENMIFTPGDMKWHEWSFPNGGGISGDLQVDSRGRLHNVVRVGSRFQYRLSSDGGRSWTSVDVPGSGTPGDFRANAEAGVAAVWALKGTKDMVYKLDIRGDEPKMIRSYEVGLGDDCRCQGIGFYGLQGGHRFDFPSIGVFPDGRVAVSFMDSKTKMPFPTLGTEVVAPQLAIEQETTVSG